MLANVPYRVLLFMRQGQLVAETVSHLRRESFEPHVQSSPQRALAAARSQHFHTAVVDIDLCSQDDSDSLLREMAAHGMLVIVGQADKLRTILGTPLEERVAALVPKPFGPEGITFHVRQAVERRPAYTMTHPLANRANQHDATLDVVLCIIKALEAKDRYTLNHSRMVSHFATLTARAMGLAETQVQQLRLAGLLHDVGMIAVRQEVLNKPGPLTLTEREHVNIHPVISERILLSIPWLRELLPVIRHHHERFDGCGYPDGLSGTQIPLGSRILAVADTYDALLSVRSHRPPCTPRSALEVIDEQSGTQFDPRVVASFLEVVHAVRYDAGHVLVFDDSPETIRIIQEALQDDGHQISVVSEPSDALKSLAGERFDLLILDPTARGSRGFQFAHRIRATYPELPMILCTDVPGLQDDISLWDLEIAAFVQKPFSKELLRQEVRRAMSGLAPTADLNFALQNAQAITAG